MCVSRVFHAEMRLTTWTYFCMASSLEVPLHFSHASHLALPLRSNMPGRAGMRKGGGSEGWRTIWENVQGADKGKIGSATRTGVDVADVRLLEPTVQLEHDLVGLGGELVGQLHRGVEFLLDGHRACVRSRAIRCGDVTRPGLPRQQSRRKREAQFA